MSNPNVQSSTQPPIVILGAGISGLALAYYLQEKHLPCLLLEKSGRVGGLIDSKIENGFLAEAGPNGFLANHLAPIYKLSQALGLSMIEANPEQKRRYIYKQVTSIPSEENLHALPMNPLAMLTTKILTWRGKLRLLREPWVPICREDETLANFTRRRFGREVLDYLINPMATGIYAGNPEQLSASAAFPKLTELEWQYGSLIRGAIKSRRSKDLRAKLYSFKDGMNELLQALQAKLNPETLALNSLVESIDYQSGKFHLQIRSGEKAVPISTNNLVIASNAAAIAKSFKIFKAPQIDLAPIISITVGYELSQIPRLLDGYGFLVPANQNLHLLGAIWSSTLFPNRAPAGHATITCMLGGKRHPKLLDETNAALLKILEKDLFISMGIQSKPKFISIHRWPAAIPQYQLGHQQRMTELLQQAEEFPGLYFTGNYIDGISVPHCVERASRLAEQISKLRNRGESLWNRSSSLAPAQPD